jgi:4-amino-4-deoxy-L-arabinose transferase-like glycosyltransferase
MRRVSDAVRKVPLPLALLLAVAAVGSLAWNLSTAPLQGPDETDHIAYVEHLAEAGEIPRPVAEEDRPFALDQAQARAAIGLGPLRQNRSARPDWSDTRLQQFEAFEEGIPNSARSRGGQQLATGKNPPLYYAAGAVTWKLTPSADFFDRLFLLRLLSGLLFLVTVAGAWLLAGEIFRRRLPQAAATSVVALLPIAGFAGGVAGPDMASAATWTLFLWLAVRMVRTGPTPAAAALTTLAATTAVLVHGRNLAIVPALALALLVAWAANRSRPKQVCLSGLASAAVAGAGLVVYRLATSSAGGALYGGETNLGNTSAFNLRQLASSIWQFYFPKLSSMEPRLGPPIGFRQVFIEQFLGGTFASNEVYMPYWSYDLVQLAFVVTLIAFYTVLVTRWKTVIERWPAALIVGGTTACLLFFLHLASYRALVNGGTDPLLTGRYLLPLVAPVGLIAATVVAGLPRRASAAVAGLLAGGLFCLSLAALFLNLERFYA